MAWLSLNPEMFWHVKELGMTWTYGQGSWGTVSAICFLFSAFFTDLLLVRQTNPFPFHQPLTMMIELGSALPAQTGLFFDSATPSLCILIERLKMATGRLAGTG